jgi:alkylation response protein AidB-like acyl-CoA dehydrogenase
MSRAETLVEWLRDYAARRVDLRTMDERRTIAPHVVLDFGRQGLLGLQVPTEWHGLGLSTRDALRVTEQLAAIDLSLAAFIGVQNTLGLCPLSRHGTAAQKNAWLSDAATGRILIAFALTEESGGSNPHAIQSVARRCGDGDWILRGEKIWIGNAAWSTLIVVVARAEGTAGEPLGLTTFLVPTDAGGVDPGEEALTMGVRSMVQNRVRFSDVRVPDAHRIGAIGKGLVVAQDAMAAGRLGIAAMSLGGIKRCAQLMTAYASRRSIATGSLIDNPVTADRLHAVLCAVAAVDALLGKVADATDAGDAVPDECLALCKLVATEQLGDAADRVVQMTGGRGYIESSGVPQLVRDARLFRIFEGPSETLAWYVGSRLLQDPRPLDTFMRDRLGGTDSASRLRATTQELAASLKGAANYARARTWIAFHLGTIAGWAALDAAVERSETVAAALDVGAWARECADLVRARALRPPSTGWGASAALLQAEAHGLDDAIGPPLMSPARVELHALLARSMSHR